MNHTDVTSCQAALSAPQFRLVQFEQHLRFVGIDDHGQPFAVTLPRLWAANLCVELDNWLTTTTPAVGSKPGVGS